MVMIIFRDVEAPKETLVPGSSLTSASDNIRVLELKQKFRQAREGLSGPSPFG
ncbi:MAG: hypothetical protein RBR43_07675 [Desulfuromonadaceae bacterium]|nr:hypothetical protein [Desulfuromonas sp.]MDY0185738.1 hypothetical protein [Desulfuromonadaceae bacterium]